MNFETIGVIGLGKMGEGFTSRLMEQGHQVLGYDIDPDRRREAAARGVRIAASPAEVLQNTDVILVCVISTKAVGEVVGGTDGLTSAGNAAGKIVVDHSTTELETTKRLARELKDATGADFVDAPVSGGPTGAAAGTLAIMAGGKDRVIETVRPLMEKVAARFAHMGDVGAGQATKLVNQVLVLANYVVIAEGVNLGRQLGIDVAQIPHALATGHAGGNLLNDLLPRMVERDFAPRGYARQILKDLNLVQSTAGDLPLPMVDTATSLFRLLIAQGKSELDGAAIVALLDGSSGELPDG